MDEPERNPNDMSRADNGAGRAAPSGPPTAESEALRRALRLTLKGYQRALPCSCHDCRRDAGATDGVGTNGGCKHSNLRQIILRATPAEPGASPPSTAYDPAYTYGDDPATARQFLEAFTPCSDSWRGWAQWRAQLDRYVSLCVAARSPAPAGDARALVECPMCTEEYDPDKTHDCPLTGDAPREDAPSVETLVAILAAAPKHLYATTKRELAEHIAAALGGAVSPSPGTRADPLVCPQCGGSGEGWDGFGWGTCTRCKGSKVAPGTRAASEGEA
jgi:hypothetical protein